MSQPCELPPCPPCPAAVPPPCPQTCAPPPPLPPCRHKPIMRGLHRAQTKSILTTAIVLAFCVGGAYHFFVGRPRIEAYRDYYLKAELEDYADEMARKGLFQAVPAASLKDYDSKK